jgi:hypothetical protein
MLTASVPATGPRRQAASRRRVDRVVGEALQMDGGHLTGTLKLLNVVSDRCSPAGTGPASAAGQRVHDPGGA